MTKAQWALLVIAIIFIMAVAIYRSVTGDVTPLDGR
jgi:hypothetical protein